MGGIFLRQGDELIPMTETPYEAETVLQQLLAQYPALLTGDPGDTDASSWLLIQREAGLALGDNNGPRGSLDHLFVDAEGVPTLIEVKRSSDSRIRREVVGQMLDYAANASAQWNDDALRTIFEQSCEAAGHDPEEVVRNTFDSITDVDAFWAAVRTNLAAEKLRLVFVADSIPSELRRIVEFLNGQMAQTEVLAVEVKQYRDAAGTHQTLVPRILGQTEAAERVKGTRAKGHWNRQLILEELKERRGADVARVGERIFEWVDRRGDLDTNFGSGHRSGSFQAGYWEDRYAWPFVLYTYGRVEIQFQYLAKRPPFSAEGLREELRSKLDAIPGVSMPAPAEKRPSIDLELLQDDVSFSAFTDAMDWAFEQANAQRSSEPA